MKLTEEQKEAVLGIFGNFLVNASAGSGKTQCFTTRIAYMVQEMDIRPSDILAITFTKKASEEMKKRLGKMIGKDNAKKIPMGTFHSIIYRLLCVLDKDFAKLKICPDWWKFSLLNDICKDRTNKNPNGLGLSIHAGDLAQFISYQKANMIKCTDKLLINDDVDYVADVPELDLVEAYSTYERIKNSSRQIDFDDMLVYMYDKLINDDVFANRLSEQYKYIMIDEFQDTSSIIVEIIKIINKKNVFVVGDFRQSIFSFINAKVDNILDFQHNFENVKLIDLNKNFRSTQNIVKISNDIIGHSHNEKYKQFKPSVSVGEIGEAVPMTLYKDEMSQISDIARQIVDYKNSGKNYKDMAVLLRTNTETALLEDVFAENNIPYEVNKSASFFDRREVLDIISYAKLAVEQDDDVSFRRVYNSPNRFLSKKSLEELDHYASQKDISLLEAVRTSPQNADWKFKRNTEGLVDIVTDLKYQVESNVNAGRLLRNVVRLTKYKKYIEDTATSPSSMDEKLDAIERLCEIGAKFPNIKAFLAHIISIKDKQSKSKGEDAVQLSTIHSSKGLEWDIVFVPNCNDGSIPHHMNNNLEEERRLFYVACSRPRTNLHLSWFLYDADSNLVEEGIFITELLSKNVVTDMKKELFRGEHTSKILYPSV